MRPGKGPKVIRNHYRSALILSLLVQPAFAQRAVVNQYCAGCHSQRLKTAGVVLEGLDPANPGDNADIWERVLRQVSAGQMPPAGLPRPDASTAKAFAKNLEDALDRAATAKANPGAPMPHRLNRTEYSNAVRDLLAVDTNPGAMLPVDDSGSGFDNMADLLSVSPMLLERYISVARTVSRLAVGDLAMEPGEQAYGSRGRGQNKEPDSDDLPFGSRGGIVFKHYFPLDAEYEVRIALAGTSDDAPGKPFLQRQFVKAGLHTVAATFLRESARPEVASPAAGRRGPAVPGSAPANAGTAEMDLRVDGVSIKRFQPPQRGGPPDIGTVTVAGPFQPRGRGETASRSRIFVCRPANPAEEEPCARNILSTLTRRAFRRPVVEADLRPLMSFYKEGRAEGDFDKGIQNALQAVLVSPDFLFRIERDPRGAAPGSVYRLNDYDLASRLSFFLWSSIPDDTAPAARLRRQAERPGRPQVAVRAHDGRSEVGRPHLEFRRPVAISADAGEYQARPRHLRRFRRKSAPVLSARNRAVPLQHLPRGPQRPRAARRELHVPQSAAGGAL